MIVYIIRFKPYNVLRYQIRDILIEICFICIHATSMNLNLRTQTKDLRILVSYIIIFFSSLILFIDLSIYFYENVIFIIGILKKICKKKEK